MGEFCVLFRPDRLVITIEVFQWCDLIHTIFRTIGLMARSLWESGQRIYGAKHRPNSAGVPYRHSPGELRENPEFAGFIIHTDLLDNASRQNFRITVSASSSPEPVTLISGAARGIGRAISDHLIASGHSVIGLGRERPSQGFPGEFIEVDFTDRSAVSLVCEQLARNAAINGVVNNVGDPGPGEIGKIDLDTVDRVMEVNFYSAVQLVKSVLPAMKAQGYGRIVNVSSELALGFPGRTAYGGAKAALLSASRTWAMELAAFGISSNCIAPGPVDTDFFNRNNPPGSDIRKMKEDRIPMGRIATVEDVARAVAFFISAESGYITGQTLFVDGGSSLGASGLL